MKEYSYMHEKIKIFGLPEAKKEGRITRLPESVIEKVPNLTFLGRRCAGARLGFRTDSKKLKVKITNRTLSIDVGMSIYSCQSAFVFEGERQNSHFVGLISPYDYDCYCFEGELDLRGEMQDILILLPRNEIIEDVSVFLDDDAKIELPTPYKYPSPCVYYGSSITEGGICCNLSNAYNAIISRHLDLDYINLGFSGNARGEMELAEYISGLDMSIFVLDYDHNAPTVEHLEKTHEKFFLYIREKRPDLPIIMLSRPCANYGEDEKKRRDVVKKTYENAAARGDKNVYFIDGESFFKDFRDKELCFIDTIHPNDLGFHKMAEVIEPVIRRILEKR